MMTWDDTIKFIRSQSEYSELIKQSYFETNLVLNVERFKNSHEFQETIKLLNFYSGNAKSILDIGSGNGISSIAFSLKAYKVTVVEPDFSDTVGTGAIRNLKEHFNIPSLDIYEDFAENIKFQENYFDVVYIRQAMHHAHDLKKFIKECARVLKPGGILFTVRDHVIYNEEDKQLFLLSHPLQKYYGGENAYKASDYKYAMTNAGLKVVEELRYYDSVINYYPLTKESLKEHQEKLIVDLKRNLQKRIGILSEFPFVFKIYKWKNRSALLPDEKKVAGRMYSFIAQKI